MFNQEKLNNWLKRQPVVIVISGIIVVISAIAGLIDNVPKIINYYEKNFQEKEILYDKISNLAADTNISYFSDILGAPVFINNLKNGNDYIYVNNYYYVQAITDNSGKVILYSVTTRRSDFNPKIEFSGAEITLGKTKFAEFPLEYEKNFSFLGARRFQYYEIFYAGNPGHYQNFILSLNDAGFVDYKSATPVLDINYNNITGTDEKNLFLFRSNNIINTFSITSPFSSIQYNDKTRTFFFNDDNYNSLPIGPDYDQVRVLNE